MPKPIKIKANFSTKYLKTKNTWVDVFSALTKNNHHPGLIYTARPSFKTGGKIKAFQHMYKLKTFVTTQRALQ